MQYSCAFWPMLGFTGADSFKACLPELKASGPQQVGDVYVRSLFSLNSQNKRNA